MNLSYFISLFNGLKLCSGVRESRVMLKDHLEKLNYDITEFVEVPGSNLFIDMIVTDSNGRSFAIVIGNKRIRSVRLNLLKDLSMPKVYILRDNTYVEKPRNGVMFINVPIYKM